MIPQQDESGFGVDACIGHVHVGGEVNHHEPKERANR